MRNTIEEGEEIEGGVVMTFKETIAEITKELDCIKREAQRLIDQRNELLELCKEASTLLTAGNLGQDKALIEKLNKAISKATGEPTQ